MTEFWDWAVTSYGKQGVSAICLNLQDSYGESVPLLLWAAWLAAQNRHLDSDIAAEAATLSAAWSDAVISPLRNLRRRLKSEITPEDDKLRLPIRNKIKGLELEAEKALMEKLSSLSSREKELNYDINQPLNARTLKALERVSKLCQANAPKSALTLLAEALTKT